MFNIIFELGTGEGGKWPVFPPFERPYTQYYIVICAIEIIYK